MRRIVKYEGFGMIDVGVEWGVRVGRNVCVVERGLSFPL